MNRLLLLAASLGVLVSPAFVGAAPPVACPPSTGELIDLIPRGARVDGKEVERSADAGGRYLTDAGLEFDLERSLLQAELVGAMPGCEQPSGLVELTIIDPFSNQASRLKLEVRP